MTLALRTLALRTLARRTVALAALVLGTLVLGTVLQALARVVGSLVAVLAASALSLDKEIGRLWSKHGWHKRAAGH